MEQKTIIVAIGMVFNDKGEILLTQRLADHPDAHMRWDIPGGTNEFGEKLEETVRREVLEETGVHVTVGELYPKCVTKMWDYKHSLNHTLVFCYACTVEKIGAPVSDPKVNEVRWESIKNLHTYDFLSTTKEFIDLISK